MKFYLASSFQNLDAVRAWSKELESHGCVNCYNWAVHESSNVTREAMIAYASLEKQAIVDADFVVVLLPGGRGAHIELGMALALQKKIYLCALTEQEFALEQTVAFYELPELVRLVGSKEEQIQTILQDVTKK